MYGCESWIIKKAEHQRIDAFQLWCWRRLLKVSKEIKPVNLKGDQPWIFTGSWSSSILVIWYEKMTHWKSPWCWERLRAKEKRASEDEMAGRHHWCNKHELGQTPEDGEGQGGLACCSPWGCKESDMTEWLNNSNLWLFNLYKQNPFFYCNESNNYSCHHIGEKGISLSQELELRRKH